MKHRKPYLAQGLSHLEQTLKRFISVRFDAQAWSPPAKKTDHHSHVFSYRYAKKPRTNPTITNVTVRVFRNTSASTVIREINNEVPE